MKKLHYLMGIFAFIVIFSNIIVGCYSATTFAPFNGLSINYNIEASDNPPGTIITSTVTYSTIVGNKIKVTWINRPGNATYESTWDEDLTTREVSNRVGGGPGIGMCTHFWIFATVSIDDVVRIACPNDSEHNCNVTKSLLKDYGGNIGTLGVWQLEDTAGSKLWYSNTTGILLNGTQYWTASGGGWMTYDITSSSLFPAPDTGIPGYNIFFLMMTLSFGLVIVWIQMKKKKLK